MTTTYTQTIKKSLPDRGQTNWHDEWWRNNNIDDALFTQQLKKFFTLSGGAVTKLTNTTFSVSDVVVKALGDVQAYDGRSYEFFDDGNPFTPQLKTDDLATVRTWYLFVRTQGTSPPLPGFALGFNMSDYLPWTSTGDVLLAIIDVDHEKIVNIIDVRNSEQAAVKNVNGLQQGEWLDEQPTAVLACDVNNDTDGGAWLDRIQGTSWFNEQLNTTTRGLTRPLPRQFVVVAYPEQVVIFDATEEDLPMWMVFNADKAGKSIFANSTSPIACLAYKDGLLVVGSNYVSATGALNFINFIQDETWLRINTLHRYYRRPIEKRHEAHVQTESSVYTHSLTNPSINAVDIVILEGAATNPATGLPQPTILAANDAAVDIIDGEAGLNTVANLSDGGTSFNQVMALGNGKMALGYELYGAICIGDIPAANALVPAWRDGIYYNSELAGNSITAPLSLGCQFVEEAAVGDDCFILFKHDFSDLDKSLFAQVGHDYHTGWLQGNPLYSIMGECDPYAYGSFGDLMGVELLESITFDPEEGWSITGTWNIANGIVTCTGAAYDTIDNSLASSISGSNYRVQFSSLRRTAGSLDIRIYDDSGNSGFTPVISPIVGIHTNTIPLLSTGSALRNLLRMNARGGVNDYDIDDIFVWAAGAEEVANGDFSDGTTDWEVVNSAILSVAANVLTVETPGGGAWGAARQNVTVESGKVYELSYRVTNITTGAQIHIGSSPGASDYDAFSHGVDATQTLTILTTSTILSISLYGGAAPADSSDFENVTIREVTDYIENGEVAADRAWSKDSGWTIPAAGALVGTAVPVANNVGTAFKSTVASGQYIILQYEVANRTGGFVRSVIRNADGGSSRFIGPDRTANGIYREVITDGVSAGSGTMAWLDFQAVTGVFTGDIKNIHVYLAERVNGVFQPVGNLVSNPGFDGSFVAADWTSMNGAFLEAQAGALLVEGTGTTNPYTYQRIDGLEVGRVYTFSFTAWNGGSGSIRARAGTTVGGEQYFDYVDDPGATPGKLYEFTFAPTATHVYIRLGNTGGTTDKMWFSGITVQLSDNYIANGNFDAEADYWTTQLNGSSGGSVGYGSNLARVTQGSNSVWMGTSQAFDVVKGQGYRVKVKYTFLAASVAWRMTANMGSVSFASSADSGFIEGVSAGAGDEYKEMLVTAASTGSLNIGLLQGGTATTVVDIDDVEVISLNELPDYTTRGRGFAIEGQLTHTAVEEGAQLKGVSGFSTGNYPWQPYDPDIDAIGTGDCWWRFWFKTSGSTSGYIYNRRTEDSSGNHSYILTATSNQYLNFRLRNTGDAGVVTTTKINDDVWHQCVISRNSLVAYIYVDGVLDNSGAMAQSMDLGTDDEIIKWGIRMDDTTQFQGSLALCAMGPGAISAEQARFMYETEREMFRVGQKVTPYRYGTPINQITHISADKKTGSVFVTNSDFVTEYQGLVPVGIKDDYAEDFEAELVTQSLPAGTEQISGRAYKMTSDKVSFTMPTEDTFSVLVTNLGTNNMQIDGGGGVAGLLVELQPGHTIDVGFTDFVGSWAVNLYNPQAIVVGADPSNYAEIRFHKSFSSLTGDLVEFHKVNGLEVAVNDKPSLAVHKPDIDLFEDLEKVKKELALEKEPAILLQSVAAAGVYDHWCNPGFYPIRVYGSSGSVQLDSAWTRIYDGFRYGVRWTATAATLRIEQKRIAL